MKTVFSARKRHYLAGAIIFLIVATLIAGMAGCIPSGAEYTPMIAASYHVVGLKSDGTVVAVGHNWWGECNVGSWHDITQVAAGGYHTVALRYDHTVSTVGSNLQGQRNGVGNWTDITQVAAGEFHTVGLKADGTVVAAGAAGYDYGQCNVGNWTNVTQVARAGITR
jgi:alpha-tubulin suppressor-like RCC1 family protein